MTSDQAIIITRLRGFYGGYKTAGVQAGDKIANRNDSRRKPKASPLPSAQGGIWWHQPDLGPRMKEERNPADGPEPTPQPDLGPRPKEVRNPADGPEPTPPGTPPQWRQVLDNMYRTVRPYAPATATGATVGALLSAVGPNPNIRRSIIMSLVGAGVGAAAHAGMQSQGGQDLMRSVKEKVYKPFGMTNAKA